MEDKLIELQNIIYGMDELIGHWFEGNVPSLLDEDVYSQADNYRNRALEIITELRGGNYEV